MLKRLATLLFGIAMAAPSIAVADNVAVARAHAKVVHCRPKHFVLVDGVKTPAYEDADGRLVAGHKWIESPIGPIVDPSTMDVVLEDDAYNVKPTAGMDFIHTQSYGSAGLGANGLNFIALSNDTLTETTGSTTLSTEIAANGLTRAQGTVAHTAGTTITTIQRTFTATAAQSCQKAALFTAVSAGTMNHALAFTQRTLQSGDTIQITFTITIT
jgi:hypothetical protein